MLGNDEEDEEESTARDKQYYTEHVEGNEKRIGTASGLSLDDLRPEDFVATIVNQVKQMRFAKGYVDEVQVTLTLMQKFDVEGNDDYWIIEFKGEKEGFKTIDEELSRLDEETERVISTRTIGKKFNHTYNKPGDAILDFEGLVEKYDLVEYTNPDKDLDYISAEEE